VTTALYIVLGVLVVVAIAMQVWVARSTAKVAGDRSGTVLFLRFFNMALFVAALLLVAYALMSGR
jgi:hypothetical protein